MSDLPEAMTVSRDLRAVIDGLVDVDDSTALPQALGAVVIAVMRLEAEIRAMQGYEV